MKTLRKIVFGRELPNGEMDVLRGGSMSNVNDAAPCDCSGSIQGRFGRDDNTNGALLWQFYLIYEHCFFKHDNLCPIRLLN